MKHETMSHTSLHAELEQLVNEEQNTEVLEAVAAILRMAQEHRLAQMKLDLIERILRIDDPVILQRISEFLDAEIAAQAKRTGT